MERVLSKIADKIANNTSKVTNSDNKMINKSKNKIANNTSKVTITIPDKISGGACIKQ